MHYNPLLPALCSLILSLPAPCSAQSPSDDLLSSLAADLATSGQTHLKASNPDVLDSFGTAIAVSGNTVAIGAPSERSSATGIDGDQSDNSLISAGAVYIFVRDSSGWTQQAYLKASNTMADLLGGGSNFGISLALSGDTLIVGAWEEASDGVGVNGLQTGNSNLYGGAAYVFVRTGSVWSQQAYLKASEVTSVDHFGLSVSLSGDTAVIGAQREPSLPSLDFASLEAASTLTPGVAFVFVRNGTDWSEQAMLSPSNPDSGDFFGTDVSIDGDRIVVGAYGESSSATGVGGNQSDNSASLSGAAYVFERTGTSWSQEAYLKASNTGAGDRFGTKVLISKDTVLVSAPLEGSDATGVNGDQGNNAAPGAGAVYAFARVGNAWTQQAYLKAFNTEGGDAFGASLAVSGDSLAIGASGEDSLSFGFAGVPSDNTASDSGAVYLFTRFGSIWVPESYLKASNTKAGFGFGTSVAFDGALIAIGAGGENSGASGVDGDSSDTSKSASGAGYLYQLPGLVSDTGTISLSSGGVQRFALRGGTEHASWFYWLLGSATGTTPGLDLVGGVHLSLNFDAYSQLTLSSPGLSYFAGFRGALDSVGNGAATLSIPEGSDPSLVGVELHHAYLAAEVMGEIDFASTPVSVVLGS